MSATKRERGIKKEKEGERNIKRERQRERESEGQVFIMFVS